MILTCPSCGTQYVVKDGAIPPQGRQVRCASCKHSWHQDPEPGATDAPAEADRGEETIAEAALIEPRTGPEAEERAYAEAVVAAEGEGMGAEPRPTEHGGEPEVPDDYAPADPLAPPGDGLVEEVPAGAPPADLDQPDIDEVPPPPPVDQAVDDDFSPFRYEPEEEPRRRSPLLTLLLVALVIAALAAAFWFLAPVEWKQRVGIAAAGETPLQLMMTHSDRQKIAPSGNELLSVSGRVINPTDESQAVPPIRAQLRSATGKLVYSWTIAPPARTLPPGASATFNSTEVNVPAGGDELTITLGSAKT